MAEAEQCETASSGSSQTLVNQLDGEAVLVATTEAQDIQKGPTSAADGLAEPTPPGSTISRPTEEEAKMSKLTVEELATELDKPNVGSDQMDVDEVMGNAIDHLRAAFKVSSIGGSEAAPDPIKQAFFSTFIDNRKKIGDPDWNRTSRSDRWVTAYPAQSGTRDLYDALANSFDLEPLPGNLLSFTTIERPAPHFHVCIQRSDGVRKNSNPITIPETLYLDRFMHTSDTQSSLFRGRKRKWDIKTRLNEMANPAAKERLETATAESQAANRPSNPSAQDDGLPEEEVDGFLIIGEPTHPTQAPQSSELDSTNGHGDANSTAIDPELKQLLSKYEVLEPEIPQEGVTVLPPKSNEPTAPPPSDLEAFWEKFVAEETEERERLTAERDAIFSNSHQVAYRLHSVVCHAGSTASAGHYWVWIHDFERDVWRKYNDTTVSVHPAEFVFGELNTKGEPYYLAYVRADEAQNLVSIPRRRPQTPPPIPPRPQLVQEQDTVMVDARDGVVTTVEHLEDANMLPPPYAAH
jgi:ubiquitin carboxyl-terminal hydrolase 25/28